MKIDKKKLLVAVTPDGEELPDHTEQLEKAGELIAKVKEDYKPYRKEAKDKLIEKHGEDYKGKEEELLALQDIPYDKQLNLVYVASTVLDVVGEMSIGRFDCRPDLEERYNLMFPMDQEDVLNGLANPEEKYADLAKEYYLYHTDLLHAPYDKLKNKCFDLLFKIDPSGLVQAELAE